MKGERTEFTPGPNCPFVKSCSNGRFCYEETEIDTNIAEFERFRGTLDTRAALGESVYTSNCENARSSRVLGIFALNL